MLKEYSYKFGELGVNHRDIEELLGFGDHDVPEPFPELINKAITTAASVCNIRGGYKSFEDCKIHEKSNTIHIENQVFSPSKIVITQLRKSTSCALFVCTAGKEISDYARKMQIEGDLLSGFILDTIGSVTVDKAMDKIQCDLAEELNTMRLGISDRYSPGYCDWSVAEQQKLFALIPDNFCGISISESSLMTPIKSISGIIGIGKDLKPKGYQCNWCRDLDCIYGRIKRNKKR